jgi:hypothetical protein
MELTLAELNDLYYCLNKVRAVEPKMIENEAIDELMSKIHDQIIDKLNLK